MSSFSVSKTYEVSFRGLNFKIEILTDLNRSCRGLLLGDQCRGDPWGDTSTSDAHCSTCAAWWSWWRWRGDGGYGGGHPGHSRTPVRDLHSAALRSHSTFLPRFLRLPHLVGGCLPGHQLSFWHLLPPVPYAELTEECQTVLPAMQPQPSAVVMLFQSKARDSKWGYFTRNTQLQTECTLFLVCWE